MESNCKNIISELQAIEIAESVIDGIVVEMGLNKDIYDLELLTYHGKTRIELDALTGNVINKNTID
ncbi:PepSY domain-containing protein [Ornithinibacillus halotolerans]|uniref:PepSY domain-containing protein n=1 Tax=Ornithinibacillus halotolerans TaxID=1274357 RepID=A0A916S301_9BACI|nr:hypothetical protein [Ornithinibacillus halotolerans]GGA81448.1 hypothetical protein GCM10008025_25950 [Ornithinibacillus halotolerans]